MKVQFGKLMGNLAGKLHLYHFFSRIGIEAIFYRLCFKEELQDTRDFFSLNSARVDAVMQMFSEEESRIVYRKAVDLCGIEIL